MRASALVVVVAVAGLALAVAAPARAADEIHAFSDAASAAAPTVSQSAAELADPAVVEEQCEFKAPRLKQLSLKQAVRRAEAVVRKDGGKKAQKKLARSRVGKKASRAMAAAGAAVAVGRPGAGLAALLRAHELEPKDPVPLLSAAPLLTNAKRPAEAIAFLDAARKLKQPKIAPFGIPTKALLANNEGFALLGAAKWGPAERQLRRAIEAEPLLSEAQSNLGHALLCQGETEEAAEALVLGARRQPPPPPDPEQPIEDPIDGSPADPPAPYAIELLDVSQGVQLTLPTFDFPSSMEEAKGMADEVRSFREAAGDANLALVQQGNELDNQVFASLAGEYPATRHQVRGLSALAARAYLEPDVAPAWRRADALGEPVQQYFTDAFNAQIGADCAAVGFAEWRNALEAWYPALREALKLDYNRATAVAAHIRNPVAHESVIVDARQWVQLNLLIFAQQTERLVDWSGACTDNDAIGAEFVTDATDDRPGSAACPPELNGKGFSVGIFELVTLSVECESISLEVGVDLLFIGAFGQVKRSWRDGMITVMAGPRATSNPTPFGPAGTEKAGLYVAFDSDGQVYDVGARTESGSEFKSGPFAAQVDGSSQNWSFIGVTGMALPASG